MSAITQATTDDAYAALRARVHWQPFHGFMWLVCPSCGSDDLVTHMRAAAGTHRPYTRCGACGDNVGWAAFQDQAIRDQLRALGAPIERRAA